MPTPVSATKISNVPRSRTYDVLESLEKKGFVVMKLGKPIKYIALPPEEVIERTTDLFLRVNTSQAELIATVMYAANEVKERKKNKQSEIDVLNAVLAWKVHRRPPVKPDEVAATIRNLAALGWLKVSASDKLPVPEEEFVNA